MSLWKPYRRLVTVSGFGSCWLPSGSFDWWFSTEAGPLDGTLEMSDKKDIEKRVDPKSYWRIQCRSKRACKIRRFCLVRLNVLDGMASRVARCWQDYMRMFEGT